MSPHVGRTAFALALFITLMSALLLPFLNRNSAEFVVTVLSLFIGAILILLIAILARIGRH